MLVPQPSCYWDLWELPGGNFFFPILSKHVHLHIGYSLKWDKCEIRARNSQQLASATILYFWWNLLLFPSVDSHWHRPAIQIIGMFSLNAHLQLWIIFVPQQPVSLKYFALFLSTFISCFFLTAFCFAFFQLSPTRWVLSRFPLFYVCVFLVVLDFEAHLPGLRVCSTVT